MTKFLIALLFSVAPLKGFAYGLSEHKRIVLQALQEYNQCVEDKWTPWDQFLILNAAIDEDVNLVRKDLLYSHFYNPYKDLNMFRYDASVRVEMLQKYIEEEATRANRRGYYPLSGLGGISHYLQDVTSPPHVMPVMHNAWQDGFEDYVVTRSISSGWGCQQMKEAAIGLDPISMLRGTAIQTLKNVDAIAVDVNLKYPLGELVLHATGEDFWRSSENGDFGTYGYLGNIFGQPFFTKSTNTYVVPEEFYATFKQEQMKLAVQSTLILLFWYADRTY